MKSKVSNDPTSLMWSIKKFQRMKRSRRAFSNFFLGAGNILDLFPAQITPVEVTSRPRRLPRLTLTRQGVVLERPITGTCLFGTDSEALSNDWIAIGGDVTTGIATVASEVTEAKEKQNV